MTEPVNYVRNADGSLSAEPTDAENFGLELAIDAGQLEATNNIGTASTSSHSGSAWFACDNISVINQSDDLLLQRTADRLVGILKDSGQFQSVRYYPTGHLPKPGIRRPDLFLTLNLGSLKETGIATTKIEAVINANLGAAPFQSNRSYFDSQSIPVVRFNAQINLDHRSTFTGIESSGAKFRTQGASIAASLAEHISKKIGELREKHSSAPKLPASMEPAWVQADQFQFLNQFDAKQFVSTHGSLLKNETYWQVEGVNIGESLLTAIHTELKAADWTGEPTGDQLQYVRMSCDGKILTAFTERQSFGSDRKTKSNKQLETERFWIHYQSLLTKRERHAAYEDLLSEKPVRTSTLLALKGMGTSAQMNRVIDLLKENPPATASGWVELAQHYFARDQKDKGVQAIQCAHLLHQLKQGDDRRIMSLVKKQKLDRSKVLVVTEECLSALGIVDATKLKAPVELDIGPERMAAVAAKRADGKWDVVALVFGSVNPATGGSVEHTFSRKASYGSSWSTGTWHETGDSERIEKLGELNVMMKTVQESGTRCPSKVIFSLAPNQPLDAAAVPSDAGADTVDSGEDASPSVLKEQETCFVTRYFSRNAGEAA